MTGNVPIKVMIPLFAMGLFTCCMVCHGELARLKPDPKYLTHFYLMISAGGALGGLLVALLAPHFRMLCTKCPSAWSSARLWSPTCFVRTSSLSGYAGGPALS